MISGIGGIRAIVAQYEYVAGRHLHLESERTRVRAGANVRGFIDGHAVDGDRLARPLTGHGVARKPDQTFDEKVAAESPAVLLLQPVVRIFEYHHIAASQREQFRGELGGDYAIARFDGVHHGAGGNHIETDEEHTDQQYDGYRHPAPYQGIAPIEAVIGACVCGMLHVGSFGCLVTNAMAFIIASNIGIGPTTMQLPGRFHALFAHHTHLAELSRRSTMRAALPRSLRR